MSSRIICRLNRNSHLNLMVIKNNETLRLCGLFCSSAKDNGNKSGLKIPELNTNVGQTSTLVQQGSDIQELPVIFRKIKGDDFITICADPNIKTEESDNLVNQIEVKYDEVIGLLNKCVTSNGILSIINDIPENILTPEIASHAFDRLIKIENVIGLRNLEESSLVFEKLINCILKSGDQKMLLDIMEILKTFLDLQKTVQRFCDELLLRNSDGILTVVEICECIDRFVDCKQQYAAEKFWTGIADAEKKIDEQNIKFIYKILPKLKISRRIVVGILEKRIANFWYRLTPESVTESIEALAKMNSSCLAIRTMKYFSRWMNTNIHALSVKHLETMVSSFTALDFSNPEIEKALSRYVKAKGIKITSESLVTSILDHCLHFRLRNHAILNGCCETFICHNEKFSPTFLKIIIQTFGFLYFQPLNGIKFWQIVENNLKENFDKFNPVDLIQIFLNCCYLEMFPLNFVKSIFNPYYLDLLHSSVEAEKLLRLRSDLKLIDCALTLEAQTYSGPLLPKDHSAKSVWQDGRIKRIINSLTKNLEEIAGGHENITKSVIIGKLPTNSLYLIDLLIHPPGYKAITFNKDDDFNVLVGILVLIPEYYDSKKESIIGPQQMRIRHLRKMGLKVATLDYDILASLKMYPKQLDKYLVERMKQTYSALKPSESSEDN